MTEMKSSLGFAVIYDSHAYIPGSKGIVWYPLALVKLWRHYVGNSLMVLVTEEALLGEWTSVLFGSFGSQ